MVDNEVTSMKMLQYFVVVCLAFCKAFSLNGFEYVYPVAFTKKSSQTLIYLIYQKNIYHLELWLWNPETHMANRALLSTCVPAGIQLWPNGKGFSFIDNGRIRIKSFAKSSLTTLTLTQPIYELSLIHWIDDWSFYFSAKLGDYFGIFYGTMDGNITIACADSAHDYMYPQKVGDQLFYIKRTIQNGEYSYSIMQTLYSNPSTFCQIYNHGANPIIFLYMSSDQEGYFVEHPALVYSYHTILPCSYYHIRYEDNSWKVDKLFDFSLPTSLLFSQQQETVLHETLLRLTPHHHDCVVYYCDSCDLSVVRRKAANLDIYAYDIPTRTRHKITHAQHGQFFFAPLVVENVLYYGGILYDSEEGLPRMWMDDQGQVCFDIPKQEIVKE